VGLHIVLVDGVPVLPPDQVPDLVDRDGRFSLDMVRAGFRFLRPDVRRQLAAEIRAQYEAFQRTGLVLDHANAHKHFHLHPVIAGLILEIGRDYGLRAVRVPTEPAGTVAAAEPGSAGGVGALALNLWTGQLRRAVGRAGCVANDHVFGLAWTGQMTEARMLGLIPHLPDGVSEVYFHPAARRSPALVRAMPDYQHCAELAALVSPAVRAAIDHAGVVRTSFGDLARAAA
jgi:hopanoid biosynthesis associated protein HpnK